MSMKIDLDRGVEIRKDPGTGIQVYMYLSQPGRFYSAHGTEVSTDMAKACGYDVARLLRLRDRQEKMTSAMAEVDAQFADVERTENTIAEANGFKIVNIGGGDRCNILDPDGTKLNTRPLSEAEAQVVLSRLTQVEPTAA